MGSFWAPDPPRVLTASLWCKVQTKGFEGASEGKGTLRHKISALLFKEVQMLTSVEQLGLMGGCLEQRVLQPDSQGAAESHTSGTQTSG